MSEDKANLRLLGAGDLQALSKFHYICERSQAVLRRGDISVDESNDLQEPATSLETPEKKKLSLRNKLLLGGAGIVLVAVAVTSIGVAVAANGHRASKATSSSPSADPTPEVTASASAPEVIASASATPQTTIVPDTYKYGLTQADVDPLLAKDVYGLNQSTVEDKAKLAMFYAQDLPTFADDWRSVSKNPGDALPEKLSAANTPEEALSFISMAHRQAMTLNNPSDRTFNKALSDKLLAASFINGTLSPAFQSLTAFGAELDDGMPTPNDRTMPASNYLQLPTINKASAIYTDATGRSCYDMNTTQLLNVGTSITGDLTVCLVKNANGQIWMER